jgi:hypothetical protein
VHEYVVELVALHVPPFWHGFGEQGSLAICTLQVGAVPPQVALAWHDWQGLGEHWFLSGTHVGFELAAWMQAEPTGRPSLGPSPASA